MNNLLHYMRQLGQRRQSVFELSPFDHGRNEPDRRQLVIRYGQRSAADDRALRRRQVDIEFDDDA